ncbi:MAG: T9SS type A sorting domain-containing protein [Ignavibacteriae bacterium]|nr:T9SS type A sorting domain-containing protein [Ignavibacteriota bacterium]
MRYLTLFFTLLLSVSVYSQGIVYDDFSIKDLSAWTSGGIEIKYSHENDNKENGFLEIYTKSPVKSGCYIGKIIKNKPFLFTAGNYLNVMLQGVSNDVTVRFCFLYDIDNNGKYNEDKDIMLQSKPISLNFSGFKETKIKLDEENFTIISKFKDDFSVTEEEITGLQIEYETGKNFKESKLETGIALISEIVNKENISSKDQQDNTLKEKESYFDAKNYPNPFNPSTTISYTLKESSYVKLSVYDRLGREVKTLVEDQQNAGTHTVEFNGSSLPSGIYFFRIKTNERTEVKKMILAK